MKSKQQKRKEAAERLRHAKWTDSKRFRILANEGYSLNHPVMRAAEELWDSARLQEIAYLESLK